jgi:translation initiation factor IF-3
MKDRRKDTRTFVRVNHKIRVAQVRCVKGDGEMVGVIPTRDAMRLAMQEGLDLVEVSPNADPPVCRIMDFGKYRYEESIKRRQARKHQQARSLKEVKFHANVGEHDYQTKVGHIRDFLTKGHKVKVTLTFRGRENAHRELGFEVVQRVIKDAEDLSQIDMAPRLMGRSVVCLLGSRGARS